MNAASERAGHERGLERGQIVGKALELLDEVGYNGLTLRKLAAKLGVKAAALYWHFENKQDLIDAMALAILTEESEKDKSDHIAWLKESSWRDLLAGMGRMHWKALQRHRDGAQIMAHANMARSETMHGLEYLLKRMTEQGFSPALAMTSFFTVIRFTLGCVFEKQADPQRDVSFDERIERIRKVAASYPTASAALSQSTQKMLEQGGPVNAQFENGLEIILDGIAQRLDASKRVA